MKLLSSKLALVLTGCLVLSPALADVQDSCFNCHGKDGVSPYNDIPIIAGMSAPFLTDTLKAYQDGSRYCPETTLRAGDKKDSKTTMCVVAKGLSADDVGKLAAFFSSKKFVKPAQSPNAALAAKGKEIHETYCEKCHSEGGTIAADDASLLAGQWMPYLSDQFKDFTSGRRAPNKKMKVKIDQLQSADFEALVNYYGSEK